MAWQYKVAYVDFRGRVSIEGDEVFIERDERRSSFTRRVMNVLGADGWELVGIQPLWPVETAYMIFKKEGSGDVRAAVRPEAPAPSAPDAAPTTKLPEQGGQGTPPSGGLQA